MMTAKRGRGRPSFVPTPALRRTVERMIACGDTHDVVARALGIDPNTLRKHFESELAHGYAKKRREIVDMLFDGAKKGNASLIKRVEEMTRLAGPAADFEARDPAGTEQKRTRQPVKGKKEVQRDEAMNAGLSSDWGDDLPVLPGTRPN